MIRELINFIVYLLILVLFISIFTNIRIKDKEYQFADIVIKEADIQHFQNQTNFFSTYINTIKSILSFNFGKTNTGEKVIDNIKGRILPTLHLSLFAIIFGVLFGISSGLLCIYMDKNSLTNLFYLLCTIILSTPVFVMAVILLSIFFLQMGILPPGGYEYMDTKYILLPGTVLGLRIFARMFLFTYIEGQKEIQSEFILYLRSRGFGNFSIVYKFLFRKILPMLLAFILIDLSSLLSGAIVVEDIFFFPGIGKSTYHAIKSMDENLLTFILFYSGIIFYFFTRASRLIQEKLVRN